jgi:acetyl-CoA carboxylase biotin carboxyl carrier protein
MSDEKNMIESTWAEARDLIRRLEGTTVQRFAVKAGEYEIEIERGGETIVAAAPGTAASAEPDQRVFSGSFAAITPGADEAADNRIPVLAPLVGTYYAAAQPGAKAFAEVGDVVEAGQTVCIVEAMKLMNEVAAAEGGKVAEICVENGEPVEFDQVLMYLEPVEA